ncbi:MAG: hypothetical protein Q9198_000067 [Flavoplaca austrocitrina]
MPPHITKGPPASYHGATTAQVGAKAEAITCENAAAQTEYFIKAFEGGQLDCGLSLEDRVFPASSPTNRVFAAFDSGAGSVLMIGIECKDLGPHSDGWGNVKWGIGMSDVQWEHVQVVIISSGAYEPEMVVVLPRHYLYQPRPKGSYGMRGFRAYWILHPLPAFPPELAPFIVPLTRLGEALEAIRKYARGEIERCFNPHTDVEYVGMPIPRRVPAELLKPRLDTWRKSLIPIQFLQKAFRAYSDRFDVELCSIFPMFGDFKFKSRLYSTELFVEIKEGHCHTTRDGRSITSMHHSPSFWLGKNQRLVFSWLAQWDFILTSTKSFEESTELDDTFFIAKNIIPASWWNNFGRLPLDWPTENLDALESCCVNLRSPQQAVQQIEGILYRIEQAYGTMSARVEVPVCPANAGASFSEAATDDGSIDNSASEDSGDEGSRGEVGGIAGLGRPAQESQPHRTPWAVREGVWTSFDLWKGLGSSSTDIRLPTTPVWQSERFMEMCRMRRRGLPLDVGRKNNSCRWGVVDYDWSPSEISRYDATRQIPRRVWNFEPCTPMVPVMFDEMQWLVGSGPRGVRDWPNIEMPKCVLVCGLYSAYNVRVSHGRLVLPSHMLNLAKSRHYHTLEGTAQFDDFLVDEDEVLDRILDYLTDPEYVKSVRQVLQDGVARLATESLSEV